MGLDISHDCWHGAYSAFHRLRLKIAEVALIPLPLMAGFLCPDDVCEKYKYDRIIASSYELEKFDYLPIQWESLKKDPLHLLLHHSDCNGDIKWKNCLKIAERLEELLLVNEPYMPNMDGDLYPGYSYREAVSQFIKGLKLAYELKENVEFH